jgi:hypothetical protein
MYAGRQQTAAARASSVPPNVSLLGPHAWPGDLENESNEMYSLCARACARMRGCMRARAAVCACVSACVSACVGGRACVHVSRA